MKGVEQGTGLRMSEVIAQELELRATTASPSRPGPNLALEIAREQPTAAVIASADLETAHDASRVAAHEHATSAPS